MTHSRFVKLLPVLALLFTLNSAAQKTRSASSSSKYHRLSLDFKSNGQHLTATVGQDIEIRLGLVGPRQYGEPLISSPSVRLEGTAIDWPPNPGGATHIYMFEAAEEGEAKIIVPVIYGDSLPDGPDLTFTVTIHVKPGNLAARLVPDQVNNARWTNAWTNLTSSLLQTFTPLRPVLTAVEVELVLANPGPENSEVTLSISNAKGAGLAMVSRSVPTADCTHVLFRLPGGGLRVTPGQTYYIGLGSSDTVFGWKYVVGGYRNGAGSMMGFNGRPLLRDVRTTFLFRTFGN